MRRIGVDVGSARTRCVVLEEGRYIAAEQIESAGWKRGRITDAQAVAHCIWDVVLRATGPVEQAVFGFGGEGDSEIRAVIELAGLKAEELVFEPVAASYAVLDSFGSVAVVDVGADSSGLIVWRDDEVQSASEIPIGGDHFSRDIAAYCRASLAGGRQIKEDRARLEGQHVLQGVLKARAWELALFLKSALIDPPSEVVVVGGGAAMIEVVDAIEAECGLAARVGIPLGNWPDAVRSPEWATAIGLALI